MDREILVNREYRNGGVEYVSIQRGDTKADVALTLLKQGLALLDDRRDKRLQSLVSKTQAFTRLYCLIDKELEKRE